MTKPKILIFVDYYLPGYKAGGPLRTIANLVDQTGHLFDFHIITHDRDYLDTEPYPNISINEWNVGNACQVFYANPQSLTRSNIASQINTLKPDIIYLNSVFSTITRQYLIARKLGYISPPITTILAPRGEFAAGALAIKSVKKSLYLFICRTIRLYSDLIWQASSQLEAQEISNVWGTQSQISIALNIPKREVRKDGAKVDLVRKQKDAGAANFVFLSRIAPKKNLIQAIESLKNIAGNITLSIYGPIDDTLYWETCRTKIAQLPANIKVDYHGAIPHQQVISTLRNNHFFLLPTFGENYGHVILEAFAAGCPVLVSDQTIWKNLQTKAIGWDIPLDATTDWENVIQQCVDMNQTDYDTLSRQAHQFHQEWVEDTSIVQASIDMFEQAIRKS